MHAASQHLRSNYHNTLRDHYDQQQRKPQPIALEYPQVYHVRNPHTGATSILATGAKPSDVYIGESPERMMKTLGASHTFYRSGRYEQRVMNFRGPDRRSYTIDISMQRYDPEMAPRREDFRFTGAEDLTHRFATRTQYAGGIRQGKTPGHEQLNCFAYTSEAAALFAATAVAVTPAKHRTPATSPTLDLYAHMLHTTTEDDQNHGIIGLGFAAVGRELANAGDHMRAGELFVRAAFEFLGSKPPYAMPHARSLAIDSVESAITGYRALIRIGSEEVGGEKLAMNYATSLLSSIRAG